ncbi:replication initiator [Nonomuraea diastatica]|uniref:replication initiator n=1 Tax=Nonomuraea diastatica TaxID=1848329 RepID=UPI001FE6665D|nr:replication initiator [Nonomuraea diastatica]
MTDRKTPRAVRIAPPLARDVAEEIAKLHGICIRPVALKRLDMTTGKSEVVDVPCGSPLESKCPPCAKRNRQPRMAQCREGWHLDEEPIITPDEPTDGQRWLVEFRADMQAKRDEAGKAGGDTTDLDAVLTGVDIEINEAGMRGNVQGRTGSKRVRSTKRRQDAPDLPKRKMASTTLGRTFEAADGRTYRPSLFVTLTLPSYGPTALPATRRYADASGDLPHSGGDRAGAVEDGHGGQSRLHPGSAVPCDGASGHVREPALG